MDLKTIEHYKDTNFIFVNAISKTLKRKVVRTKVIKSRYYGQSFLLTDNLRDSDYYFPWNLNISQQRKNLKLF